MLRRLGLQKPREPPSEDKPIVCTSTLVKNNRISALNKKDTNFSDPRITANLVKTLQKPLEKDNNSSKTNKFEERLGSKYFPSLGKFPSLEQMLDNEKKGGIKRGIYTREIDTNSSSSSQIRIYSGVSVEDMKQLVSRQKK